MTSSTWSFESSTPPRFCGVDAERVVRFASLDIRRLHPFPFVFSAREVYFHRRARDPSRGLCASFCCKEAVFKALAAPLNFTDCELLYAGEPGPVPIRLARSLCREHGLARGAAMVRVIGRGGRAEVVVAAYLF
jgi:hypothetical protein